MSEQHPEMSQKHNEPIVSPTPVIAAGLAAVLAAFVTSRFGVAQTLIGEAFAAMIATTGRSVFRAYLAHMGNAMAGAPILRSVVRAQGALEWFFSLPPGARRPILFGGLLAGVVAFSLGLGTVTAAELSAGKSLPCWIWGNCPRGTSDTTLPSVMGGGLSDEPSGMVEGEPRDDSSPITEDTTGEDSLPIIEGKPGNDEQPPAGRGLGEGRVPLATENTEEDTAPSRGTKHEETKGFETAPSCDVEEPSTRRTKKDVKPTTATTGDGQNQGPQQCAPSPPVPNPPGPEPCEVKEATGGGAEKKDESPTTPIRDDDKSKGSKLCAHGAAGPKDTELPAPKEPSGRTTQGRDDYNNGHDDSHQGESPVQEKDPVAEQPPGEASPQDDGALPKVIQ
jgi:hypothetical protein